MPQVGAAAAIPTGSPTAAVNGAGSSPANSPRPVPPPPLPPNLRRLELSWGASPRLLAAASRLPHLETVLFHSAGDIHIVLDQSDVVPFPEDGYCRLRPETIEAFGPAARLLARVHRARERTEYDTGIPGKVLTVTAEAHPAMVVPPEGELDGHAVWIRQLAPLREVDGVKLAMLTLQAVDVLSVAKTLKGIRDLDLSHCSFPMAALPCLGPLPKLRTLRFNADHCTGNSSETVQSALLSMCLQVVAACLQHTDSRRASRRYASPGSLPQVIHEEYRNPPAARINPRPLQHGMPLQFPHSATCLVVSIHPQGARAVLV